MQFDFQTEPPHFPGEVFDRCFSLRRTAQTWSNVVGQMGELAIRVITGKGRLLQLFQIRGELRRVSDRRSGALPDLRQR